MVELLLLGGLVQEIWLVLHASPWIFDRELLRIVYVRVEDLWCLVGLFVSHCQYLLGGGILILLALIGLWLLRMDSMRGTDRGPS